MPELRREALGRVPHCTPVQIVEQAKERAAEMRDMIKEAPAAQNAEQVDQDQSGLAETRTPPCPTGWGSP